MPVIPARAWRWALASIAWCAACGGDAQEPAPVPASPTIPEIQRAVSDEVLGSRIEADVRGLAYPRNPFAEPEELVRAGQYIAGQLEAAGYEVRREPVTHQGVSSSNIVADLVGTACPDTLIIVGAHYDSVPGSPAAVDNASGVAVALELARVLRAHPAGPTLRLVAFTLEENGLIGSRAMASELAGRGADVRLAVSLDMLGYTTADARMIFVIGDDEAKAFVDEFERSRAVYAPGLEAVAFTAGAWPSIPELFTHSDHAPFWEHGYPAVQVTNSAERMPYIHTPGDTVETVDFEFATRNARAVASSLVAFMSAEVCPGTAAPE